MPPFERLFELVQPGGGFKPLLVETVVAAVALDLAQVVVQPVEGVTIPHCGWPRPAARVNSLSRCTTAPWFWDAKMAL